MPRIILLAPVLDCPIAPLAGRWQASAAGLGYRAALFDPFAEDGPCALDRLTAAYASGDQDCLLEDLAVQVQQRSADVHLLLIAGLEPQRAPLLATRIQHDVIKAIDAEVALVAGDAPAATIAATARLLDVLSPRRLEAVVAAQALTINGLGAPVLIDPISDDVIQQFIEGQRREQRLSPAMFRAKLIADAAAANKRIVLPEGEEPRTIKAAAICQRRGIARCVLLGRRETIDSVAKDQGVDLAGCEIIDPSLIAERYVEPLVAVRQHKGMTPDKARAELADNVWVGTMMMHQGEIDGLVSGAVHSTANTIRPALQVIKTKPGCSLVSSAFFMCLPDQVLVFADCAVCTNPTPEQLADIAIESGRTARAFGIPPRVAMISYSTKGSGSGPDVDAIEEATRLALAKAEAEAELLIDGPLQYDAAAVPSVGHKKAPGSPVAGAATVYVFPDLNTGNSVYKAVQRTGDLIAIGPMLQGMAMPVNDLSRGALVDDIVFTIALTAVQAASLD